MRAHHGVFGLLLNDRIYGEVRASAHHGVLSLKSKLIQAYLPLSTLPDKAVAIHGLVQPLWHSLLLTL